MPFNGSGVFNRLYSWVTDATNNVPISAPEMDNETNGITTGLGNCVTRDGQSPWLANLPAGGFKLTGLANGSAASDSATIGQINSLASQWIPSGLTPTFVSATQFTVPGNVTALATMKRRILLTVNGVQGAATITSSSFGANTAINVATDSAGFLTNLVTAFSWSILDGSTIALPRKTQLYVAQTTTNKNLTSGGGGINVGGGNPFPADTTFGDIYNELAGTGIVTVKQAGTYLVQAGCFLLVNGAAITVDAQFVIAQNGSGLAAGQTAMGIPSPHATVFIPMFVGGMVNCAANDQLKAVLTQPTFTAGPVQSNGSFFSVTQL